MGCLHRGHLSLIHRARKAVGPKGIVITTIFVNPTQFGPNEDFNAYPRPFSQDKAACAEAGTDILFHPTVDQLYPKNLNPPYSTYVVEESLSTTMEGVSRPIHFRGVATIVVKLFNLSQPDYAIFGAKDFQQAAIIRQVIRDLNIPTKLIVAPTVRERDGLAMSSRNRYLNTEERQQATSLHQALRLVKTFVRSQPRPTSQAQIRRRVEAHLKTFPLVKLDYFQLFDPNTLDPVTKVQRGHRAAIAAYVGSARLIDNLTL